MSNRDWRIVAAAGGIALAAIAYAQPIGRDSGSDAGPAEDRQEPSEGKAPVQPPSIQGLLNRIAGALEAANNDPNATEKRDQANRDLDAQEGMAKWAKWMFGAVLAQTILTVVGIILIWRTLLYTRDAAIAARDAVEQAKNATAAANASVAETKRIGEAQTRAYLVLEPRHRWVTYVEEPGKSDRDLTVYFDLINTGQTPGIKCEVFGAARFVAEGYHGYNPTTELQKQPIVNTYCGAGRTIPTTNFTAREAEVAAAIAKKQVLVFYVRVNYTDVFKAPHHVEACAIAKINVIPPTNDPIVIEASVQRSTYPHYNGAD